MIEKVKHWLGIEGVKMELHIPEGQHLRDGMLQGSIHLQSMHPQTVTGMRVVLIERYSRGRGEEQRIDEYELGTLEIGDTFEVLPDTPVDKPFLLKFKPLNSEIDAWGNKNVITGQLAKAARWLEKAQSQYRLEAEARVKGVALNPFDKKKVNFQG
jgi:hypothetical protein